MERCEIQASFRQLNNEEGLMALFNELCASPETALPIIREMIRTAEDFSTEEARQEFRLAILFLALQSDHDMVLPIVELLRKDTFQRNFPKEDWIFNELPRLLGKMLHTEDLPALSDWILDRKIPDLLREPFLLTIMFRWMQKMDRNAEVVAVLKKLLTSRMGGLHNDKLSMALIINAIAVDSNVLKPLVLSYYNSCGKGLAAIFPNKVMQAFYQLGADKIREMLMYHYDATFGNADEEIARMFHPSEEPTTMPEDLTVAPKPIVRESPKISRNDPCPCGSGKKYKKCCGA